MFMGVEFHLYKNAIFLGLELFQIAGLSAFGYGLHRMSKNLDKVVGKYNMKSV